MSAMSDVFLCGGDCVEDVNISLLVKLLNSIENITDTLKSYFNKTNVDTLSCKYRTSGKNLLQKKF